MAREYPRGCEEEAGSRRVSPGAKSAELEGLYADALKLSVAVLPEKGRANTEAERCLADVLARGVSEERAGRELESPLGG